ncbi:hypothetical protein M9Y10_005261 [Tritrichomonas musculus]|uniref:Tubby C-terminal domain-containing protein n=1 Tax=Tritrichomonas musculus TaxID=1915356 RepID=A0ABR2JLW3_9EUKA
MRGKLPRRPFRPGRGGLRGGFANQPRNIHMPINFSDSYSDYESSVDDIQVINVKNISTGSKPLLLSDSEEDSSSYSPIHSTTNIKKKANIAKETDWNSKKTPPDISRKRIIKEDHLRGQSKPFGISSSSSYYNSDSIEENKVQFDQEKNVAKSSTYNEDENTNNFNRTRQHHYQNKNISQNENTFDLNQETNSVIHSNIVNATDNNNSKTINNTSSIENNSKSDNNLVSNDNNNNFSQNLNTQNDQQLPNPIENIDSNNFQNFTVVRKGKKFSKMSFQLLENNSQFFKSTSKKDGKKTIQLIFKENLIEENISSLPIYVGYVRSRKKKRFYTLYTTDKKNERDDREGELLSICFHNNNDLQESSNSQSSGDIAKNPLTVIISKYGKPNYAITQRLSLESFAETEKIDESKYIKLISTEITSEVENESGSAFYIKSSKNCALIEPNSNKYVFIFLKSTYEIFNMKVRPPLTPLQGFGLAISLIKHSK